MTAKKYVSSITVKIRIACLCVAIMVTFSGFCLTEQESIIIALQQNPDIRIAVLNKTTDSLGLESVKSGWLTQITGEGALTYSPLDKTTIFIQGKDTSYTQKSLVNRVSVQAGQAVPGGGTISGSVQEQYTHAIKQDSSLYTTSVGVSFSQPLLKGAFNHGAVDYAVRIRKLDNQQFTLSQKKSILSTIGAVRTLYWSLYEKQLVQAIFRDNKAYTLKKLETIRAKFAVGQATSIDTLSAQLELLDAERQCIQAQNDVSLAAQQLATALNRHPDSLDIDTSRIILLSQLPPAEDFVRMVEEFDPQVKIFAVIRNKLLEQNRYAKNQFLPQVNAGVGYRYTAYADNLFSDKRYTYANAVLSLIATYSLPAKPRRIALKENTIASQKNDLEDKQYAKETADQIDKLIRSWNLELRLVDIAHAAVEIARQRLEAAKAGYAIGTVDLLTLQKAEQDYLAQAIRALQNQITLKQLEIIFDEMTGTVLSRFGVSIE